MYENLMSAMHRKHITYSQIAKLLKCQLRTVSDKAKGDIEAGFSIDEALLIKNVYFPEYDIGFLFARKS
ncbi:hypothetical protein HNQ56_004416 [Anaerotaenia torta]|uniref:DNA-binding protein n=1 Tax=Anaerotaenia torta TaxID=433293 RepID=UPI003D1BCD83